jgi:hypothetical protein
LSCLISRYPRILNVGLEIQIPFFFYF